MASKADKILDRLEEITRDVNDLKRKAIPLLPVPPLVKSVLRTGTQRFDDTITDAYFGLARDVADVVLPTGQQEIFLNSAGKSARAKPRKVTKKMKLQRKIQSKAFKSANAKGRLQNGTFRAGYDQSRIARMAQKECTAERIRLGLCDDPKKKMKRKSRK